MRRLFLTYLFAACTALAVSGVSASAAHAQDRVSPRLQRALDTSTPGAHVAAWVFFTDKGNDVDRGLAQAEASLTPRARERRLRHHRDGALVDRHDIPVPSGYVEAVRARVARVRHVSKWLNAVSVDVAPSDMPRIAELPFVRYVDVVRSGPAPSPVPTPDGATPPAPSAPRSTASVLSYGGSLQQNSVINTIPLHDLGYNGNGVLIAMLDSGFNLDHDAFTLIDILATRDFVNGDSVVADEPFQAGSASHGTQTLSVIGGFAPGHLIGTAWGATYALAKTENTDSELHIEEDNWVAAAEWADSLGADIISSSVGYRGMFNDGGDYAWTDFDGNTTIVTVGADIAAAHGILVVNSAGNYGWVALPENTLIGPSDGDSVLCVGAVDGGGARATFSSVGPTADGRFKPDVMGMGSSVLAASPYNVTAYGLVGGTSFSCPMVAGAAALLLEARPSLTNMEIIDALRATASQALAPDRLLGWGIVDAAAAFAQVASGVAGEGTPAPASVVLYPAYPNPFNPSTTIRYELPRATDVLLTVHDVRGRLVTTLASGPQSPGLKSAVWDGTTHAGARASSGVYFYRLVAGDVREARRMVLLK